MKKASWITIGVLSSIIGLYPMAYFLVDRRFGLLSTKSEALLQNTLWNVAFYSHITLGGLALLIGWLQFNQSLRTRRPQLHRNIGKVYIISVLISGLGGLIIAFNATGGFVSTLGFSLLSIIWLSTTLLAFQAIKKQKVTIHERLMIYSYAACFAAVSLRIWLPLLTLTIGNFITAYQSVAWLCWVPNIAVAYFIIQKQKRVA